MNLSKASLILLLLIVIGCDDDNSISNQILADLDYVSNFKSSNTNGNGVNKYSVDIEWDEYEKSDFLSYEILDNDNSIIETILSSSITGAEINLDLNELKVISLRVNQTDGVVSVSQLNIFTRPIQPITNFSISATSESSSLSWIASEDTDIQTTILYKAALDAGAALPVVNELEGTPNPDIWSSILNYNGIIISYIDNEIISNPNYYYVIKIVDTAGNYRFSNMQSNIPGAVEGGTISYNMGLAQTEPTSSERTSFIWNDYSGADFFEYQIFKSNDEDFSESTDDTPIAVITNKLIDNFQDYEVGFQSTYYYKIRLYNIYGNYTESETIACTTY